MQWEHVSIFKWSPPPEYDGCDWSNDSHAVWKWKVSYGRWGGRNKISIKIQREFRFPFFYSSSPFPSFFCVVVVVVCRAFFLVNRSWDAHILRLIDSWINIGIRGGAAHPNVVADCAYGVSNHKTKNMKPICEQKGMKKQQMIERPNEREWDGIKKKQQTIGD